MNKDVNLIGHLPSYLHEYDEISQVMGAENPEFQVGWNKTTEVEDNSFILYTNEDGISRFEKMMGILPSTEDTLDARKSRVLSRWNDGIPYTYKGLIQKLTTLCGEGNFQVTPDFNDYELTIETSLSLSGQVEELDRLLGYMIPANIVVISNNELVHIIPARGYVGNVVSSTWTHRIDTKVNTDFSIDAPVGNGFVMASTRHNVIDCE